MEQGGMEFKIMYKDKIKKPKATDISSFATLLAEIKKKFPQVSQDISISYHDGEDEITIQNQDEYQQMVQAHKKIKILVKQNQKNVIPQSSHSQKYQKIQRSQHSQQQSSTNSTQVNSTQIARSRQEKQQQQSSIEYKSQSPDSSLQDTIQQILHIDMSHSNQINNQSTHASFSRKKQPFLQVVQNKTVLHVHQNIKCRSCGALNIKGTRWVSLKYPGFSMCDKCYSLQRYKQLNIKEDKYPTLKIQSPEQLQLIDYRYTLYRMFDSKYKQEDDDVIRERVTQEDILQNRPIAVKNIWKASQPLCKNILDSFKQWQKTQEND